MAVIIDDRHPNTMMMYILEAECALNDVKSTLSNIISIAEYLLQSYGPVGFGGWELMQICTNASFELEALERALARCKKRVTRLGTLLGDDMSPEDANEITEAEILRSIEEILSSLSINFETDVQEE